MLWLKLIHVSKIGPRWHSPLKIHLSTIRGYHQEYANKTCINTCSKWHGHRRHTNYILLLTYLLHIAWYTKALIVMYYLINPFWLASKIGDHNDKSQKTWKGKTMWRHWCVEAILLFVHVLAPVKYKKNKRKGFPCHGIIKNKHFQPHLLNHT